MRHRSQEPARAGATYPEILEALRKAPERALSGRDLAAAFALDRRERQAFFEQLDHLVRGGFLSLRRDQRYTLPGGSRLVSGVLRVQRGGFAFVSPVDGRDDIFVPARNLGAALDGDTVSLLVLPVRGRERNRREGQILAVTARGRKEILGRYVAGPAGAVVLPIVPRMAPAIPLRSRPELHPQQNDLVVVRLDEGADQPLRGEIVRVLGHDGDPAVDVAAIAWKYELPETFPAAVLEAAASIPADVSAGDEAGRIDLRTLPLVTIDGETARDFDDAVAIERLANGYRLWVAIADVSYYVTEKGLIDREARSRGTSVYFPDRCLPMLPEALSNGICSLNPGVDRLVVVAEMEFSVRGEMTSSRFYRGVMHSRARLTYTQVYSWLQGEAGDPELVPRIRIMAELAAALTARRSARGSIDFDLAEAQILFDRDGRPEKIVRSERNQAHRLIEEFMLAANEAVAQYLTRAHLPFLYRVHELPAEEKMMELQEFAGHLGYGVSLGDEEALAHSLQQLLAESDGRPEGRAIHQLVLRSLKQARYAAANSGHFGLAAEEYCHFTSPIRRYPDLVVHRILCQNLSGPIPTESRDAWARRLPVLADETSRLERRAVDAEREMLNLSRCRFMADKIGREFSGMIANIQHFGLFVELDEIFVEGLVPLTELTDDYYQFDPQHLTLIGERRRRVFRIGDPLRVRVARVDIDSRQIDLSLISSPSGNRPIVGGHPAKRKRRL